MVRAVHLTKTSSPRPLAFHDVGQDSAPDRTDRSGVLSYEVCNSLLGNRPTAGPEYMPQEPEVVGSNPTSATRDGIVDVTLRVTVPHAKCEDYVVAL